MSIRIGSGIPSSAPIQGPDDINSLGNSDSASRAKKLKKGIADEKDTFENAARNAQIPGHLPQLNTQQIQPQNANQNATGKVEGSQAPKTDAAGFSGHFFPYQRKKQMDENGYVWLSENFMPWNQKQGSSPLDDDVEKDALDRLGELWKDYADRMSSQSIRA